jgi:tripartite-type tricarboxylate transporter receptor subunit TctC
MRRLVLKGLGATLLGAAGSVRAQSSPPWPSRPVRVVVPFSTGTAADLVARALGTRLSAMWGQSVLIENVQGAGGNIGAATVAKASADGYTLLMGGINLAINPSLYRDMQYELQRDFRPIALVGVAPLVIVANPSLPASTITELVALSRQGDKPILYGSGGNGSITHLALEMLKSQTGAALSHVPYKGIAQMMTDVIGNQIPLACPALASALGAIQSGRIKALAVTTAQRSSLLPSVPTVREAGIADFDVSAWNGLLAPARTPDEAVARILSDVDSVVRMPEFVEGLRKQALEPDFRGPEAFRSFLAGELDKWSRLARASGARMD